MAIFMLAIPLSSFIGAPISGVLLELDGAAARRGAMQMPGLAQLRVFANPPDQAPDLWVLAEFSAPVTLSQLCPAFGQLEGRGADVFNLYAPYDKTGSL